MAEPKRSFAPELDALAATLRTEESFAKILSAFEQLTAEPGFVAAGHVQRSAKLDGALACLAERAAGRGARVELLAPALRINYRGFLHGAAMIGGRVAMFFYFEDLDLGLAALGDGVRADYYRFATVVVPSRGSDAS